MGNFFCGVKDKTMEQQNIEYIYQMSRRKTEAVKNDFPALIVPKKQLGKPFDWHQGLQGRGKDNTDAATHERGIP